jgi:hypothetical protein
LLLLVSCGLTFTISIPAEARGIEQLSASATHIDEPLLQTKFSSSGEVTLDSGDTVVEDTLQLELDGALQGSSYVIDSSGSVRSYNVFHIRLHYAGDRDIRAKIVLKDSGGMNHTLFSNKNVVNCG